jgi:serine-type D-Ala-D-Ala carboxypeptidase (penicillin-binding protein 5/6)
VKNGETLVSSPLVAKASVKEANWWTLYKRAFGMFTKTTK